MSHASEVRTSALDRVVDGLGLPAGASEELWAVVDVFDTSPAL